MERLIASVVLVTMLTTAAPAAVASHGQETSSGATLAFDHKTGNEWWVEVTLSGSGASSVTAVEAQDTDGPWVDLEEKDWGAWGASFHIEPGHEVRFTATLDDGSQATSCWFTHPDGDERCRDGGSPPTGDDFEARFDPVPGNEWWVETYVDAERDIASVEARAGDGPWNSLTKRDWGAWAASFFVEEDATVQFRAQSTDGEVSTSQRYHWPEAEPVDPPGGQDSELLDAAFGPKAGNSWWVETYAIANSTITGVEARANEGDWHELTFRDWGAWAGSFHVPAGSEVVFRATNETGAVGTSDAFLWPDAVPAANPDGEWPQEGSYVHYDEFGGGPDSSFKYERNSTFVYHDDRWLVRCEGYSQDPGGREQTFEFAENAPAFAPTDVSVGDQLNAPFATCDDGAYDVTVDRQETETVHREGDRITIDTWFANRTADCNCQRWNVEWDADTGLVTDAFRGGRTGDIDDLQDTDAPIG